MALVTYPLLTVVDDSGNVVSGVTVAITSVKDKSGTDIATPGAAVNVSGANISVDYDAELKGEAWVVLAISKAGSVFTGMNAAPAFYLARDSSRIIANLVVPTNAALLAPTGLDNVNPSAGAGSQNTFRGLLIQAARKLIKPAHRTPTTITMLADDGSTPLWAMPVSDDGAGTETQGNAS